MEIQFQWERSTKRTERYAEVGNDGDYDKVIGTLYLQREVLEEEYGDIPKTLTVVIEVE